MVRCSGMYFGVFLFRRKPVALAWSGDAMNTDMSAFMGLSPNNELTYSGLVSVHGIYMIYIMLHLHVKYLTMNMTDTG